MTMTTKELNLIALLCCEEYTKDGDTYTMIGSMDKVSPWQGWATLDYAKIGYVKIDDNNKTVTYGGYGIVGWEMEGDIEEWASKYNYQVVWDGNWQTQPLEPVGDWKWMSLQEEWDNNY